MGRLYADEEVFTICGRVVGGGDDDKTAFVVAESASLVTHTFADWGFEVTSMASLADVGQNLEILEALAGRNPEVAAEEFLDLLPAAGSDRLDERNVFTFVGQAINAASDTLQAGFATAPDREFLTDYLRSKGFETYSVMSYAEVRELHDYMSRVAAGDEDDPSNTVNLKH